LGGRAGLAVPGIGLPRARLTVQSLAGVEPQRATTGDNHVAVLLIKIAANLGVRQLIVLFQTVDHADAGAAVHEVDPAVLIGDWRLKRVALTYLSAELLFGGAFQKQSLAAEYADRTRFVDIHCVGSSSCKAVLDSDALPPCPCSARDALQACRPHRAVPLERETPDRSALDAVRLPEGFDHITMDTRDPAQGSAHPKGTVRAELQGVNGLTRQLAGPRLKFFETDPIESPQAAYLGKPEHTVRALRDIVNPIGFAILSSLDCMMQGRQRPVVGPRRGGNQGEAQRYGGNNG